MALEEDTRDLSRLAEVDPEEILDSLNSSIARRMPSYADLYRRWERLNWSVDELDFSQDRRHWSALDETHRERLLWTLSQFYVAEQRVAATLTPYVAAAPLRAQKLFLSTQCVDESRHTVFFDRFFHEVVAEGDRDLARRLRSSRRWVGPGFAPLFDEYLEDVTSELRAHPEDLRLFAKAMAVYHIIIEGVLALTGQKFILAWARDNRILPGFRAGFTAVARDESRHVSFGARVIRDLLDGDPGLIDPVHQGLSEALLLGTRLFQPPNGDVSYTIAFGYSLADLFDYGGIQLEKKMRAIDAPMPKVDIYLPPIDAPWPPPGGGLIPIDPRRRIGIRLLEVVDRVTPSLAPGISMMMLHLAFLPEAARGAHVVYEFNLEGPGGGTFTVEVEDGDCAIVLGRGSREPDVRYHLQARTWLEMTQAKVTGDEAILLGRLRITGDPSLGRRFNELFAPQGESRVARAAAGPGRRRGLPSPPLARFVQKVLGRDEAA
ncbi:MAG: ribonucleotide-diphosphate reductase subunit beta [Actinomycetota bacterium]